MKCITINYLNMSDADKASCRDWINYLSKMYIISIDRSKNEVYMAQHSLPPNEESCSNFTFPLDILEERAGRTFDGLHLPFTFHFDYVIKRADMYIEEHYYDGTKNNIIKLCKDE